MKKYLIVKLHYGMYSVRLWGKEIAVFNSDKEAKKYVKKVNGKYARGFIVPPFIRVD